MSEVDELIRLMRGLVNDYMESGGLIGEFIGCPCCGGGIPDHHGRMFLIPTPGDTRPGFSYSLCRPCLLRGMYSMEIWEAAVQIVIGAYDRREYQRFDFQDDLQCPS